MKAVEAEFLRYQFYSFFSSFFSVFEEEMDIVWYYQIGGIKGTASLFLFSNLAKNMLACLTIFYSNADCERIFSIVGKKSR